MTADDPGWRASPAPPGSGMRLDRFDPLHERLVAHLRWRGLIEEEGSDVEAAPFQLWYRTDGTPWLFASALPAEAKGCEGL